MKTLAFVSLFLLLGFQAKTQDESKYDLRIGVGQTILGTGDNITLMIENEGNMKLNNYFTAGIGIAYANSNRNYRNATFLQGNGNIFVSPFKNDKRNDFRLGSGVTFYKVNDSYASSISYTPEGIYVTEYRFGSRSSIGLNIIIENTFNISKKLLLGLKLFTQPYLNGDINSGVMLKFGVRI